ncbi:50S ribosomal protein L11 [Candidatus Peregrinibacteria bacterium]|nr:MAG: 50S ribosomal protein L11 [Candidatus Peregrinibacteria bacterium]
MAKHIKKKIKVVVQGGAATPAPPLGPALGQAGIPINDFVQRFNAMTENQKGLPLPTQIIVYDDKSFDIITKQPTARYLIMKEISLKKGSGRSHVDKVATIKKSQLEKIAETKMVDMNANDVPAAVKILAGTCRSAGINVDWDS